MSEKTVEHRHTYAGWIEALTIFAKYNSGYAEFSSEHDQLYGGVNPELVSAEDIARLDELGWHVEEHYECFYKFT